MAKGSAASASRGRSRRVAAACLTVLALLLWVAPSTVADDAETPTAPPPVTLLVFERSPYYVRTDDGGFGGLVAGPVARAFEAAGVPYVWRAMQPNGHLRTVAADREPVCAVGWFRTETREHLGLFSDPISRDRPQVVLTRVDNSVVMEHTSLEGLLSDSRARLGTKLGYSYGAVIDGMIESVRPPQSTVSQDDQGLVRMVLGRRFDYMITSFEEADALISRFGAAGEDLVALTFEDSPPGNTRHLVCSRSVGRGVMARINAALAEIRETSRHGGSP
ncbi:transporter substrate-binding domain-containing protein [uncultured Rhodospira sp.]|uniref:substrate-binding periplasmic protein n=1 Tax=uncultured Rhodospira sp. TaxID=1936189 RepID=UPI00260CDF99|nr:transporter substrate-binding domain-containing protein [uncultured Rhodospira sp.]